MASTYGGGGGNLGSRLRILPAMETHRKSEKIRKLSRANLASPHSRNLSDLLNEPRFPHYSSASPILNPSPPLESLKGFLQQKKRGLLTASFRGQ